MHSGSASKSRVTATSKSDICVIGGGFYGLFLAHSYARQGLSVRLFEAAEEPMSRASYSNQARVHNGHHYPRSLLTAQRSRVNYARFTDEFEAAIKHDYEAVYAIARRFSSVSAAQFALFMTRIGAPVEAVGPETRSLFDPHYVEDVFLVQEAAFDCTVLRRLMLERLGGLDVEVCTSSPVHSVASDGFDRIRVSYLRPDGEIRTHVAGAVVNCTYASINDIHRKSGLPLLPLKHEWAEICLCKPPAPFDEVGITVMCGPFFSLMPFPAQPGAHTLSHVRWTPHFAWMGGGAEEPSKPDCTSAFEAMRRDAARYCPDLREMVCLKSLWETKTILPQSEIDDSRPILFKRDHGLRNYHVIMGGKIDNVYDVAEVLPSIATPS